MPVKSKIRKLCMLGMLSALTVVLGFYTTWRFGPAVKVSLKFCPVFISGALFGPVLGGVVGCVSDIASFIANPSGGFIPLITVTEFFYGMLYGFFFFNKKSTTVKCLLCTVISSVVLDFVIKSYALSQMMGSTYGAMLLQRIPAVFVNFVIQFVFILVLSRYLSGMRKLFKI